MVNICCTFCGIELKDGDAAYGLTSGRIDNNCYGFRMDTDDEWGIYCCDCMNQIDRLMASYKHHGYAP